MLDENRGDFMFIKIIPQGHCAIVIRFGKPIRIARSGLNFFVPFFDSLKDFQATWGQDTNKDGVFIELSEQITDTRPRDCFTKDNVKLTTDCAIRWRISDPLKAAFEVDNLHQSLREVVLAEMRAFIGDKELNYLLSSRQQISEHIISAVSETTKRWGINVISAEIQELTADDATIDAMRQKLEASRRSEALKLEAEGKAEAIIREAKAVAEASILQAEAQKKVLLAMAEADKNYFTSLVELAGQDVAGKILIAQKQLRTYEAIVKEPANKVFIPLSVLSAGLVNENQ